MSLKEKANQLKNGHQPVRGGGGQGSTPMRTDPGYQFGGALQGATLHPGRKLYEGGMVSDVLDFLNTGSRASAALVGHVLNPSGGSYLQRYRDPDMGYAKVLQEHLRPGHASTPADRLMLNSIGLAGDIALDPLTYIGGAGIAGKLGEAANSGNKIVRGLAKAGLVLNDPLISGVGKPLVAAVDAGIPGFRAARPVLKAVRGRKVARELFAPIRDTERLALGKNARAVTKNVEQVDTLAAKEAERLTGQRARGLVSGSDVGARRTALQKKLEFRQGVGKALDAGYDAHRASLLKHADPALAVQHAQAAIDKQVKQLAASGFDETAIRNALQIAQQQGNRHGAELAARGILDPATVAGNADVYARRIYQKHERPADYLRSLQNDPVAFMQEEARQAQGLVRAGGGNPVAAAAKKRLPLDVSERNALGQITDVAPRLLKGGDVAGRAIARKDALDQLAKLGVPQATAAAAPEEYRLLTGTKWGPADGVYLPKALHDEVMRHYGPAIRLDTGTAVGNRVVDAAQKALNTWKFGKVVLSPAAMSRNIASNAWRGYTELGISPLTHMWDMLGAARDIRKDAPIWQAAQDANTVFGGGTHLGAEFRSGLGKAGYRPAWHDALGGIPGFGVDAWHLLNDKAAGLYEGIEQAGKLGITKRLMKRGATLDEGAQGARRALFDYGDAPYWAQIAGNTGLLPFARYPSLAIPAEAAAFARTPGRFANIAKGIRSTERLAPDVQQGRYEERTMPDAVRNNAMVRLPFKDPSGRSLYYDFTSVVPVGGLLGTGPNDSVISNVNPFETSPWLSIPSALTQNKVQNIDRPIVTATDPAGKAEQVGSYLWDQFAPPLLGYHQRQIRRGLNGDTDRTGQPISATLAALRGTLGLTMRPITADTNVAALQGQLDALARRHAADRAARAYQGASDADLAALDQQHADEYAAAVAEMQKRVANPPGMGQ